MKAHFLNLFLLFWSFIFPVSSCDGYEFTVEGEVRIQGYSRSQLEGETNYNFTAEIRDCGSRIRVFGGCFSTAKYNEYGWDTTNSYIFIKLRADRESKLMQQIEGGKIKETALDKPVKSPNDANLNIYSSDLPDFGRGIEPVWLAYASACDYRARKSGNKPEPVRCCGWFECLAVDQFIF